MPLGHRRRHSQPVERCSPLVCIFSPRGVGGSEGRGIHVVLCASSELGRRQEIRAGHGAGQRKAGRSKASGTIITGIDANCNADDNNDQRGSLVKDLPAWLDVGVTASGWRHEEEES